MPIYPIMEYNRWVRTLKPNPNPTLRLFCFSHAGGGASLFRLWHKYLPSDIEICPVQLPGRESRVREIPYTEMTPLVEDLTKVLKPALNVHFAFFGHSLGALIAFELARYLRKSEQLEPDYLIAAACPAPHIPDPHLPIHHLPRVEFIDALRQMDGTPDEVFNEPGLLEFFLPLLRADFTLYETYIYYRDRPLDCPISAYGGLSDKGVEEEYLDRWTDQTNGLFVKRMFPGNHYFLRQTTPQLFQAVLEDLSFFLQ